MASHRILAKKFTRTKEDFTCQRCGFAVRGNGYTNHCPRCLWSKHADIEPGDRAATCGGAMEPVGVETKKGAYRVTHRCAACGAVRTVKAAPDDSMDTLAAIAEKAANRVARGEKI